MPQVSNAAIHYSFDGNNDAWPLNSQNSSLVEDYKEHIRMAIESGIGGFQMLAGADKEIYEAARQIKVETGRIFYIAPEWCDTKPDDPVKWADTVADFVEAHRDDPHVFRRDGKMVLFTYYSGKWERSPEGISAFRARLEQRNVDPLMVPTISDKILLDRSDLGWRAWPEGRIEPGPVQWLKLGWKAATAFDMETDPRALQAIRDRLATEAPGFFFIPSVAAGYDNSNRPSQATRVPFHGVRTLLDGLSRWKRAGFRQFTYVTWNDCNESLLLPSSRNIWGYNTIVRYFQGLLESGFSPFSAPEVVVAYPVECLYGDTLDFQVLGLPAAGQPLSLRAKVEWLPVSGGSAFSEQQESSSKGNDGETFLTLNWDSSLALGKYDALQPRVTIEVKAQSSSEWKTLYDRVLLPPVRFSYNLVRFPSGYAINLDKVSTQSSLRLEAVGSALTRVSVTAATDTAIRRLHLNEGSRSLGIFRQPLGSVPGRLNDLFLRIESSANIPLELRLTDGVIRDLYTKKANATFGVTSVEKEKIARFPSFADGSKRGWRAVRIDMAGNGQIDLGIPGSAENLFSVPLSDLEKRRVTKNVEGKTVSLSLSHDGTDPNIDFPLPAEGYFEREVPLFLEQEGVRVVYASALLASGKMAFSNAVQLEGDSPEGEDLVKVQWIESKGAFDDFNRNGYSKTYNSFSVDQVLESMLPRNRVPYFHLDFEEGAGPRLNDRSTEHQPGRAWLEQGKGKSHAAGFDDESNGNYQWLEGRRGMGILLKDGERVRFRSKSSPVGPISLSVWLEATDSASAGTGWKKFDSTSFALAIGADSRFTSEFQKAEYETNLSGIAQFRRGWNHLVFVYDLQSLRIYLNGELVGTREGIPPLYQRTHSSPSIFFADKTTGGMRFTGKMDELEIIGAAIDEPEVKKLWEGNPWRPLP